MFVKSLPGATVALVRSLVASTMRIGELAAKVGVSVHVLRAWESRYGLMRPVRSAGGYRLYGHEDERRVREVIALRDTGVSAVEASRRVLAAAHLGVSSALAPALTPVSVLDPASVVDPASALTPAPVLTPASVLDPVSVLDPAPALRSDPRLLVAQLLDAIAALDEDRAHAVLDTAFAERAVDGVIVDVLLPLFAQVGVLWERGQMGIAEEHFATSLVRRRLGVLSLAWGVGTGPIAVLACPPGEHHDLVLFSFGVLLGRAGWRVRYLGPDTPVPSVAAAARLAQADAVVLACRRPPGFRPHAGALRELGAQCPVWLAGRGATPEVLAEAAARHLSADLVEAVAALTSGARDRRGPRLRSVSVQG